MSSSLGSLSFTERLSRPEPLLSVELRPPRADLERRSSMEAWMDVHRAVRRLAGEDTLLFVTDNAVGKNEEENLHHLVSNLGPGVGRSWICPFLTCKHTLEYCLWYADRAVAEGHEALTVLGGDESVGPPRCLPHSFMLRQRIRERHPGLALGGWANPHGDVRSQAEYLTDDEFTADFYLTQIVSHHDLAPVEAFLEASEAAGVEIPGVFGVFYYRSANPRTLRLLSDFLPVPAREITRDFRERGLSADEVCARTVRALRRMGVDRVYVSNLRPDEAEERLRAIRKLVETGRGNGP